jgi:hypothetical protein
VALLDRQKREAKIGEIRVGTSRQGQKGRVPVRLSTFRFTSRSEDAIRTLAELYGGEARPWTDGAPTPGRWELISRKDMIPVAVPPGGMLTQDYEHWVKGVRLRLCDSQTERLQTPRPCVCAAEGRDAVSRLCKPKSRLRVMLPDVPGLGVWVLSTVSGNAADELAGVVEMLERHALAGRVLPAELVLEQRFTLTQEARQEYPVVVLRLPPTLRQLVELAAGMAAGQIMLPEAPPQLAAIEARRGTPPAGVPVPAPVAPTPSPAGSTLGGSNAGPGPVGPSTPAAGWERPRDAQHLARMVETCPPSLTWVGEVRAMAERADWMDAWVETRFSDAEARLHEVFAWRTDEITEEQVSG